MRSAVSRPLFAMLALGAVSAAVWSIGAEQDPRPSRAEFMRKKLEYSKLILEGLSLEDYDKIARGSKALALLSRAAEWEVPTIPNVPDYVVKTRQFQDLTDELSAKAREKNLDGSTLVYLRLTLSCVDCHKYVRFKSE